MAERKIGEQKGFILYNNTGKLVNKLSDAEAGRLFKAIFDYKTDGIEPRDLTAAADMLFCSIQQYLDKDAESYRETCIKRAESGQKGGRTTQQRAREKREANQANALNAKADQADININVENNIKRDIESGIEREKRVNGSAPADLDGAQPKQQIDRERFQSTIKTAYSEVGGPAYSVEDCLSVFNYFLDSYEKARGEAHPPIKRETVKKIIIAMPGFTDEHEEYQEIYPEDYPAMIDSYFDTPLDCDYHIQHFFCDKVRMIRYYETVFNE